MRGAIMEELLELRTYIEQQRYADALALIGEMEEMSKDDKVNKIYSYAVILILHLIKRDAERRTTRSWEFSIRNAAREIKRINYRRKSGGYYLTNDELLEIVEDAYQTGLEKASLETFEGEYNESQLACKIDKEKIKREVLQLISAR